MKDTTLCFLIDSERICLAMKKRGFGVGKWNGVGGKTHEGETVVQAALREMQEEIGVLAHADHLEKVAMFDFNFLEKPEWTQRMHVFLVQNWQGEPIESEEMAPEWHSRDAIPYADMWVDDPYWLPRVIKGEKLTGTFRLTQDGSAILTHSLSEMI